ncbi:DUF148 domain-containing protein [Meloidogyne graminicola]|uniref:DUF148 domain-containing protein n=1 Tax=Meloidogyne graminicola TaxID=189291 RepID=A0A8S9ZJ19_9BILA|nr:DUF148 domain-containing protein [Meloidogyne graminicola]
MTFLQKSLFLFLAIFVVQIFAQNSNVPPPPPFLNGAPQLVIKEFLDLLMKSGGKTDGEIEQLVKNWIAKQTPQIQANYAKFEEAKNKAELEAEKLHQAAVAKFSAAAKEADAKLSAIAKNPTLPAQEKNKLIHDFMDGLKPEVRNEIEKSMQQ